ncbi:hypothetical protein J31TS4_45130 [Paenibacillus sp. J31TS4]|uniref:AAA family ATPase n=1 Tax=Paenibacillus sp. J31TS4 TaxID=2807195 RepID=UPI001B0611FA|nr:AAA family ATPase [Paenibacillus sp. J31TS4]GIP41233.1 hypothetical protein J31TS4_45130 [Paenibacillus sp. J31TS4]
MAKRIHILGAAGSGTTTLGRALAEALPHVHLDTDDFYWEDPGVYTAKRPIPERLERLSAACGEAGQWVLTGSLCGWGDPLIPTFDLVVFLVIPQQVRLMRLEERERERYGRDVLPGGTRHGHMEAFLSWAARYETGGPEVRSRALHEAWLAGLTCPVVRIEGDTTVEQRVEAVLAASGREAAGEG